MKTLSEGARIVADSTTQTAFYASLNAAMSSEEPSPTAPKEVTSKMQFDVSPRSFGYGSEGIDGGLEGGSAGAEGTGS